MKRLCIFAAAVALVSGANASWYWPFGDDEGAKEPPRLSELMEPVSIAIDEAANLSGEARFDEAVEKYRKALAELDRIEIENPERVDTQEFVSVKTRRAYVTAAIDSLLLKQARDNAMPVTVTDTTELESRLAEEARAKAGRRRPEAADDADAEGPKKREAAVREEAKEDEGEDEGEGTGEGEAESAGQSLKPHFVARKTDGPMKRPDKLRLAGVNIANGDYEAAAQLINELLFERPGDAASLNLRAAMEAARGDYKAAERALDQAITSNPRAYHAYYNMARLKMQANPDNVKAARRYYETGRTIGGPKDAELERIVGE